MAVYPITRYPKEVALRDGATVQLRPMTAADAEDRVAFFRDIPDEERFLLKDDVTSPEVVCGWANRLDYDRALPLLALADGRLVADAVLIRHRGGSRAPGRDPRRGGPVVPGQRAGRGPDVGAHRDCL
jgi:hypothetical protein